MTGAGRGIGAGVAGALAAAGAQVVLNYRRSEDAARREAEAIEQRGGSAFCVQADVSVEADVQRLFGAVVVRFGTVDILFNNAGIQRGAPFHETTLEDWNAVLHTNLTGQFLCAREAVREFLRRGMAS